ncbi:hypothetical protein DFH11DRAFT_1731320 [Phellopilus nigrolimitatus]|nr:hypothetical protein DFH11DRAFT_1731320 [Phellopilus nigrolimitatus]
MHRSSTRKEESRASSRGAVPPGRKAHAHGSADVGPTSPTTETVRGSEKRSKPSRTISERRARPLISSTNTGLLVSDVLRGDATTRASSAQSQRKMWRTQTPIPPDGDDDWSDDLDAPPVPMIKDKSPARARTPSAGDSRSRAKSEERDASLDKRHQETFRLPRPHSRYVTSVGFPPSAHQDNLADDDQAIECISSGKLSTASHMSHDSKARDAHPDGHISRGRSDFTSHSKPKVSQRRRSWGRSKKEHEEPTEEESNYKRASKLGLPKLEKDLLPSLRDTVHRMTGSTRLSAEDSTYLRSSETTGVAHNLVDTLVPPPTRDKSASPALSSLRSPTSPMPKESTPVKAHLAKDQYYDCPREMSDILSLEYPTRTRKPLSVSSGQDAVSFSPDPTYAPKHAENSGAIGKKAVQSQIQDLEHSVSKSRSTLKTSLRTPRPIVVQELSPNIDADGSASEPTLKTPRARSSSAAHTNPFLSVDASPVKKTSPTIPSPSQRSRTPSSGIRPEETPSSSQSKYHKLSNLPSSSYSPTPITDKYNSTSYSPRSAYASTKISSGSKSPSARSPTINKEDKRNPSRECTPKPSYAAWNQASEYTAEANSNNVHKRLVTDKHSSNRPVSRAVSSHLSPRPDYVYDHPSYSPPFSRGKSPRLMVSHVEQSTSEDSQNEIVHYAVTPEDSHARRRNELVDLVAGLGLNTGPQDSMHADDCVIQGVNETELLFTRPQSRTSRPQEATHQDGSSSRRSSSLKRVSFIPKSVPADVAISASEVKATLRPDWGNINRDSLIMLNAERQREAFGIPPSISSVCEGNEMLSSAESNVSLRNPVLDSEWEGEVNDGLGLSLGAEKLFHALGIGAEAHHPYEGLSTKGNRTSWRSSMAEAEKYITESLRPVRAPMSASSSSSSIYEDEVPDRPWQKRERDLDRVQSVSGSSIKTSWRKTLSHSAYVSLLERHGDTEMRRQEVIWELCETEQAFLKSLRTVLEIFVHPLLGKNRTWVIGLPSNVSRLMDWLDDIFQLHAQISSALQHTRSSQYPVVLRVSETLRTFIPRLEVYQPYIVRLDEVVNEIEMMMKDPKSELGEYFRIKSANEECANMTFSSFLWLPLTRLGRYLKHFNELWDLTPRSHVDHLPTFSLLHSATLVVRVMREVKLREEEYTFVKDLVSRVHGLPSTVQLIRRERRLVAHGALQRVHLSERSKNTLEDNACTSSQLGRSAPSKHGSERHDERSRRLASGQRRRANSLDSCLNSELSDAASMTSISSAASNISLRGDRSILRNTGSSRACEAVDGGRRFSQGKTRLTPLYAFIFTDLALFTVPISSQSKNDKKTGKDAWELLDDIGICRVLSVTDHSGTLGYDHMIGLHVLPMDIENLDAGILSDTSATSLFVHLPKSTSAGSKQPDAQKRWWDALEQCYLFTLRSLSFPTHSGRYLAHGSGLDQEASTRQTVMSILASGLPLPKSPSGQIGELEKGQADDATLREREERGWWALRFQQTLHEMQREDLLPASFREAVSSPSPCPSTRKTVSARRRLKLGSGRKSSAK